MRFSRARPALALAFLIFLAFPAYCDRVKWSSDFDKDVTGGIIVEGNYIYITHMDTLEKVGIEDGRPMWNVQLRGTLLKPVKIGALIIAISKEGVLYEVNDATRSIVRTVNLTGEALNDPLIVSTNIYIPTSTGVKAYSTLSNRIVWEQASKCAVQATPLAIGDRLLSICDSGAMHLLLRSTGETIDVVGQNDVFWKSSPAIIGSRIMLGSYGGKVYSFALAGPRNLVWAKPTIDGTGVSADIVPGRDETYALIATEGGSLCAVMLDGSYKWCIKTKSQVASKPIVTEGGIYAISDSGVLYGIDGEGNLMWEYDMDVPVRSDLAKSGSMLYAISKTGRLSGVSLSSCTITFPEEGSDVSGVDVLEVEVDAYSDTPIRNIQVRSGETAGWIDAAKVGGIYVGSIPSASMPLEKSTLYCRVISGDGTELPPYSGVEVLRGGAGKAMSVEAPGSVGYGSKFTISVKDERGNYLDRVNIVFGNLNYRNINGPIEITPADKGIYRLEVRRAGYVPYRGEITVGDDYTVIIATFIFVAILIAVFYVFYRKWMEE